MRPRRSHSVHIASAANSYLPGRLPPTRPRRTTLRSLALRSAAAAALLVFIGTACSVSTKSTQTKPSSGASGALQASLSGAGATFPAPLYLEWISKYTKDVQSGVHINYQGIGSGGGVEQFIA